MSKLLALTVGAVFVGAIAFISIPDVELAIACREATPACLPRYRAAGHKWYANGVPLLARAWYRRGANAGDPIAMFDLGWAYHQSGWAALDAARVDPRKEPTWPELALDFFPTGRPGNMGPPGPRFAKAARWYELSRRDGFAPAVNNLAALYAEGAGVEKDQDKVEALLLEAAEAGNPVAAMNVIALAGAEGQRAARLKERWSKVEPSPPNLADFDEPTFERTICFFCVIPEEQRIVMRAVAKANVLAKTGPLEPHPSMPHFRTVPDTRPSRP